MYTLKDYVASHPTVAPAMRLLEQYFVAFPKHREGFRKNVHWWWRSLQDDPRFKALIGAR